MISLLYLPWYLFIQLEDKTKSVPAGEKTKAEPKEEWAINVDINTPVHDFYKRIPDMAYKVPDKLRQSL